MPEKRLRNRADTGQIWKKTITERPKWGVCDLDGTVIFVQLVDGRVFTHGFEAVCRWCGGPLELREDKVFCAGVCGHYQGSFSPDLDDFLRWNGVLSFTLRREVARVEGLHLEARDLEPISYVPQWSVFDDLLEEESNE